MPPRNSYCKQPKACVWQTKQCLVNNNISLNWYLMCSFVRVGLINRCLRYLEFINKLQKSSFSKCNLFKQKKHKKKLMLEWSIPWKKKKRTHSCNSWMLDVLESIFLLPPPPSDRHRIVNSLLSSASFSQHHLLCLQGFCWSTMPRCR